MSINVRQNGGKARQGKMVRQNGGGGASRNRGLPYYIEVFLEIPYDAA